MLITGYLSAVAAHLDQRHIAVRSLHVAHPGSPPLAGYLLLAPHPRESQGWKVTRLDWDEHFGWRATLRPTHDHDLSTNPDPGLARYLPHRRVPAPITVAHFTAALNTDPHTPWASYVPHTPTSRIDRAAALSQLGRFAAPEPW
jgi:hypothetical protein